MRRLVVSSSLLVVALAACAGDRSAHVDPARSAVPTGHPFQVEGTVQSVGGGILGLGGRTVTIARQNAPSVALHVASKTVVILNDRPAPLSQLREGDQVRAIFDFDQDTPVAIEIDARPRR
jgi:hypothetical protein